MKVATVAERPDLLERGWERTRDTLPEYNNHGDILERYWPRLSEERPEFQFHLVDEHDEILVRARSVPVRWDGTVDDLPAGTSVLARSPSAGMEPSMTCRQGSTGRSPEASTRAAPTSSVRS